MSEVLFTHDDLDGAGCRIIYELAHQNVDPSQWKVFNCSITGIDKVVMKYLDGKSGYNVTFADIGMKPDTYRFLMDGHHRVSVYDHHVSNLTLETYAGDTFKPVIIPENEFGVLQSGTSVMYQQLCMIVDKDNPLIDKRLSEMIWKFVDTVRSYDIYEFKTTGNLDAKKMNTLFKMIGMDNFCNMYIERLLDPECHDLFDKYADMFIMAKINGEQSRIDKFTPKDVITLIAGNYQIAFAMSTHGTNVSELAYQFLKKYPEYCMFISYSTYADGGAYSFRTVRDDIDLSKIAGSIGGGGHPKAAGAGVKPDQMNQIIQILISGLPNPNNMIRMIENH